MVYLAYNYDMKFEKQTCMSKNSHLVIICIQIKYKKKVMKMLFF